jgi:hypothetical protein
VNRRDLLKTAAALPVVARADVPAHRWDGYDFGCPFPAASRLNQGPFDIDQDEGWLTLCFTTPSSQPVRNYGLGLVGYAWEEGGPSLAARAGREALEHHVEQMASLPFVDVLYIRCDWRDVQTRPGKLDLHPVWALTTDAAKRHGLRAAFRVQLSNTVFQPERLAMPDFVRQRVPLVKIGREFTEPRYDHPAFQAALEDLNDLLAARFDGDPLIEWVDLMQYGFWGEGHTSDLPSPFPDYPTAEKTSLLMTGMQLDHWKRTPLAVNTQPDISKVGNREVIDMSVRAGAWLRSDSIIVEEPVQIEMLANRPPWSAAILEDGYFRQYDTSKLNTDTAGVNTLENYMLHVLDLRANYWSLWTETANLAAYNQRYPRGFRDLRARMGYRIRPGWVWQRKRYGASEVIVAVCNSGVAAVPGVLWLHLESPDGKLKMRGSLDPGHPRGGGVRQASFLLPAGYTGRIDLRAEIEIRPGVMRPAAWSCEQPVNAGGAISFEIKPHTDAGWRKGV